MTAIPPQKTDSEKSVLKAPISQKPSQQNGRSLSSALSIIRAGQPRSYHLRHGSLLLRAKPALECKSNINKPRIGLITSCRKCDFFSSNVNVQGTQCKIVSSADKTVTDLSGKTHRMLKDGIYEIYPNGLTQIELRRVKDHDHTGSF